MNTQEAYNQLSYYTLARQDSYFIHQHIVDAYAAQTASKDTKPIKLTFALAGLYLFLEKGFTGKQVQNMHVVMGKKKREWPTFTLAQDRGEITVLTVLAAPLAQRDRAIKNWCKSVWDSYKEVQAQVAGIVDSYLI